MLSLHVRTPDGLECQHDLDPGAYTIGRGDGIHIPLHAEAATGPHARVLVSAEGSAILEDLAGGPRTYLDDTPLTAPGVWRPGQTAQVGGAVLTLSTPAQSRPKPAEPQLPPEFHSPVRYSVGGEIARGGMGAILAAREATTRRVVAMKIITGATDHRAHLRFIEEAQITAQLEHPNIIPVHDLGRGADGRLYYTMKRVQGITLRQILEQLRAGTTEAKVKYSLPCLLTIFQKTCDALAYAHSRGVIHRDLKPANIMVGEYGEVLLMDWGLAKLLDPARTPATPLVTYDEAQITLSLSEEDLAALQAASAERTPVPSTSGSSVSSARAEASDEFLTLDGTVMGTPHYMAPEQARGENRALDQRTDVWAMGIVFYELLTLARPFSGENATEIMQAIIRGEFTPPIERAGDACSAHRKAKASAASGVPVPFAYLACAQRRASLDAICRKALRRDPAERYQSVAELQADLTAYQNGFATTAEQAGTLQQLRLLLLRHRGIAFSIAAALALLAVVVGTFTTWLFQEKARAEEAMQNLKRTAPTYVQHAQHLLAEGALDDALAQLDFALSLDPAQPTVQLQRAHLLQSLLRWPEARDVYRALILAAGPEARSATQNLALMDRLDEGGTLQIAPGNPAVAELAAALTAQGRTAEAAALRR